MLTVEEMEPQDRARALEILRELELTEWQRWVRGAYRNLQEQMQSNEILRRVTIEQMLQEAPITKILGDTPMSPIPDIIFDDSADMWKRYEALQRYLPMSLTPQEEARAIWILRELELTEYQRYMRGLVQRSQQENSDGQPTISYRDALIEAKQKRARNPEYKSKGQILAEKPDEIARRARIEREQAVTRAAMLETQKRVTEQAKAIQNPPADLPTNPHQVARGLMGIPEEPEPTEEPTGDAEMILRENAYREANGMAPLRVPIVNEPARFVNGREQKGQRREFPFWKDLQR